MLFSEIYKRAVRLFDDPKITVAYNTDKIAWQKMMYGYFSDAVTRFTNPAAIAFLLADFTDAKGTMQTWDADGVNYSFQLDDEFEIIDDSLYQFMEDGVKVDGTFDSSTRTVTFPHVLDAGSVYSFEQYFCGQFNSDFSEVTKIQSAKQSIYNQVISILSRLLLIAWAENEKNELLDIRNLMTDADFKNSSNASILKSKISWVEDLQAQVLSMQNKLGWIVRSASTARWGMR